MSVGDYRYPHTPTYWPNQFPTYPPAQPNYCPTCGKPWFGGWCVPRTPEVCCKVDTVAAKTQ